MKNPIRNQRGNVMPYMVFLISMVAMPLMVLSIELVRAMYVDVHLQTAIDAACGAAVQAVNVPHFIQTGELMVDISQGRGFAQREFDATVVDHNLRKFNPALVSVNLVDNTTVSCFGTAEMQWTLPVPALTFTAFAISETQAVR